LARTCPRGELSSVGLPNHLGVCLLWWIKKGHEMARPNVPTGRSLPLFPHGPDPHYPYLCPST